MQVGKEPSFPNSCKSLYSFKGTNQTKIKLRLIKLRFHGTAECGRNGDWDDGQRSACCGMWAGCLEQGCECLKNPHKPGSNVMS